MFKSGLMSVRSVCKSIDGTMDGELLGSSIQTFFGGGSLGSFELPMLGEGMLIVELIPVKQTPIIHV